MKNIRRVPVPKLWENERDALLGRDVSATVAFVDREGFPRMVPCWFLWDCAAFYVPSDPDKFHGRCLNRNNRASICVEVEEVEDVVAGEPRSNRWVKAVGRVEMFEDDAEGRWWRRIRRLPFSPRLLHSPLTSDPVQSNLALLNTGWSIPRAAAPPGGPRARGGGAEGST